MIEIATIISAIAAVGAVIASLVNARKIQDVHVSINSRMDQLLSLTAAAEKAKGVIEGRAESLDTKTSS